MNKKGYEISDVYLCGGHTKNKLFLQEHADITGCRIPFPREREAVLLGTAIFAAVAAGKYRTVLEAMESMSKAGEVIAPNTRHRKYHGGKHDRLVKSPRTCHCGGARDFGVKKQSNYFNGLWEVRLLPPDQVRGRNDSLFEFLRDHQV